MKKRALAWMAALILGTTPPRADPIPAEIVLARALFAEARAAEEAKDWALAASKLREAIAIKDTGGLRFHLAYCEEQQGLLVEALVDYERSDDLTAGTAEEFRAQLPAKRESLRRRIPTVTLLVPPTPTQLTLTVDGHAMPTAVLGKPIPLNPGRHALVVTAPDHAPFTTQISLNETDAVVANALLTPLPKRPVVSALKPPAPIVTQTHPISDVSSSTGLSTRSYVLIGEGAVALGAVGVGIGYTLLAASEQDRAENIKGTMAESSNRDPDQVCHPPQVDAEECGKLSRISSDSNRYDLIARVGFIAAGAAAASFVGTLILWRPPAKVAIVPSFGPGAAQLSVATHF